MESNEQSKKPWESKTNIVALMSAVIVFIPPVQAWVAANPEAYASILAFVFMFLRMVTKDKIVIK